MFTICKNSYVVKPQCPIEKDELTRNVNHRVYGARGHHRPSAVVIGGCGQWSSLQSPNMSAISFRLYALPLREFWKMNFVRLNFPWVK